MKRLITTTSTVLCLTFVIGLSSAVAQIDDPIKAFKGYINDMVVKVEHAKTPEAKRTIMNDTFDELLSTFNQVKAMPTLTQKDQKALHLLAESITAKQNELNGLAGYKQVPNNQLNEFAHYVQQDMEQAETITISIVVALLIVVILLLL